MLNTNSELYIGYFKIFKYLIWIEHNYYNLYMVWYSN